MKFYDLMSQVMALLQREGRVSYRALKREFDLEDDVLEDLKEELITVKELAVDKDGKMLVWVGTDAEGKKEKGRNGNTEGEKANWGKGEAEGVPGQWTPPHLAERIHAVTVIEGERKTIIALFADLKGSTALIEGLDPEEARAIIDPALQLMMDAVHQYDGYVAQALGDGIFALFGALLAHEDHPQRALYAALRMQEAMRCYADTLRLKNNPRRCSRWTHRFGGDGPSRRSRSCSCARVSINR